MPTPLKRRLRLARRGVVYGVALMLVCLAVVIGVAGQLLPVAERKPERIAAWLSDRAGRPVAFDRVETQWTRRGPLLRLDGLRVGAGADAVRVGEAEVLVSMYAGLLPGRSFTELRLRNLRLTLRRAEDGVWSVLGLPGQGRGGDPLKHLEGLGELQVIDARLAVLAPSLGWELKVPKIDLRLRVDGNRVRAGAHARARAGAAPLRLSFDFDRRSGDGRGYMQADRVDLSHWTPVLRLAGVAVAAGSGQAKAWVELRGRRVETVTSQVQLSHVVLQGMPLHAGRVRTAATFDRVEGSARWRSEPGGWRFDAPSLRVGTEQDPQRLDGLTLAGGARWAVLADRVQAQPLLQVLALSDRLDPELRRWLVRARPGGELSKVAMAGNRKGLLHARGAVTSLRFDPAGDAPGLSGLGGTLIGDAEGFSFELDPASKLRIDWPLGFGAAHAFSTRGRISGWREGSGWRVASPGLHLLGRDLRAQLRGGFLFQGDGTRPRLDLAAQVEALPLVAARQFLVRHRMPRPAVQWLDRALLGGTLRDTRALVSGDLDDWPFRGSSGRLEASARITDGRFKFHPEWPVLDEAVIDARWLGNGLTLGGRGALAGVAVDKLDASIADFAQADLAVSAEGQNDAGALLQLLRLSPLNDAHAETLRNLVASGPARATFELLQPLRRERAALKRLAGAIELRDAKLSERRWKLDFDRVRGRFEYGLRGFQAEQVAVNMRSQPGLLSLRGGDRTRDGSQAFEAGLAMSLTAAELLDRAPAMAWLKPHMEGRSRWSVGVSVPKGQALDGATRLQLRSDLVGTTLKLPAPLDKPQGQSLAALVQTSLPLERGQVEVALGGLLSLRARSSGGQTGVRVMLGGPVTQSAPASGVVVEGRTGSLDALEWTAMASTMGAAGKGGGDSAPATVARSQGSLPLRRIDVTSGRLLLLGGQFPDTRLQVVPSGGALSVTMDGPALAGRLRVPDADGAAITGDFERAHWLAAGRSTAAGPAPRSAAADTANPARIPPLALEVADLRVGQARLGRASLRTQPVAAGLRVQQLALRSAGQQIDITGDWVGRGAASRTRVSTAIASDNLGGLLEALGFKDHLRGGKGKVQFDASWAGGPSAFALRGIDGRLSIDARDGQLLELEPGAGRVLGLLSIAQLPRRVLLDFRDFFSKGFAFDRIDGQLDVGAGVARSENLRIEGPAAEIRIRGSTDLAAQQFNQTIQVLPRSGNLLTVVGAVAGGPLGAAVGAAANAVLRKPLGELGAKTYRVTGPWKDPEVQLIRQAPRAQVRTRATGGDPG